MEKKEKKQLILGVGLVVAFAIWTWLIQKVDVQPVGQNGTDVGFATFNCWFHKLTGVHMELYILTDWLGLVPLFVCMVFGGIGLFQLVKRKSFFRVDCDLICLGIYYVVVILGYLIFEMYPVNYRPILIDGILEASYPSSTTLLVLSVMPTLILQGNYRIGNRYVKKMIFIFALLFSAFMVVGRLISGVHWFTDIIGAAFLSSGLFYIYKAVALWLWAGKGYPSLDSLKGISSFFSVTIDELLSGEKLISIAEKENRSNLQNICNLLTGIVDVFSFMLIVLPLYPKHMGEAVLAVNLFSYSETAVFIKMAYWGIFLVLIMAGVIEIVMSQRNTGKGKKALQVSSMIFSIIAVIFLALTREAYATTLAFMLFLLKGILTVKHC